MFSKIMDQFDDFDMEKVMHVVNLVWDNKDRFLELIEKLPDMLNDTGTSIEAAGDSALAASSLLMGDPKSKTPSAGKISEMAADALERCQVEIANAAKIMEKFGVELDDIQIPSFKPEYKEVMGFNVITGVDMSENKMIDNAAERLKGGSDRMEEISKDLKSVAGYLRQLGGTLTNTGEGLDNVGHKLKESGGTLRSLISTK
ncbi:MAG: hypothetical protein ACI9EW_004188 [Cellvibrionaceae bacterium]|jgi:hypothetical protein